MSADSFQDLLLASLPKLRAYAMFLTKDRSLADDLLQESVVRALNAKHQFAMGTNFNAWIHRILHNQYVNYIRQNSRNIQSIDNIAEHMLSLRPDQEQKVIMGEVIQNLSDLPINQREALLLVCGSGMSYDEAADVLNCSIGTVKSRVWRARRHMERMMMNDNISTEISTAPSVELDCAEDQQPYGR